MIARTADSELATELAALDQMDRAALKKEWRRLFASTAPQLAQRFLRLALAYRIQELALGGLKPETVRLLRQVAAESGTGRVVADARDGTILVREWKGVTHHVQIAADGVIYRDQRYRSLTQVARVITGAHWSGPRFFGLVNREAA